MPGTDFPGGYGPGRPAGFAQWQNHGTVHGKDPQPPSAATQSVARRPFPRGAGAASIRASVVVFSPGVSVPQLIEFCRECNCVYLLAADNCTHGSGHRVCGRCGEGNHSALKKHTTRSLRLASCNVTTAQLISIVARLHGGLGVGTLDQLSCNVMTRAASATRARGPRARKGRRGGEGYLLRIVCHQCPCGSAPGESWGTEARLASCNGHNIGVNANPGTAGSSAVQSRAARRIW